MEKRDLKQDRKLKRKKIGIERSSRGWGLNDKAKKERERNRDIETGENIIEWVWKTEIENLRKRDEEKK